MARARDVIDQALTLPLKQRARVAHEILISLDGGPPDEDPAEVERAWSDELGRRLDRVKAGTAKLYDWEEVRRTISADLRRISHGRTPRATSKRSRSSR